MNPRRFFLGGVGCRSVVPEWLHRRGHAFCSTGERADVRNARITSTRLTSWRPAPPAASTVTCCLAAGRGAVVSGTVHVTGQAAWSCNVEVGGTGGQPGQPAGGFNGGRPWWHGHEARLSEVESGGASEHETDLKLDRRLARFASAGVWQRVAAATALPAREGGDAESAGQQLPVLVLLEAEPEP